jgi:hypothetical protein
MTFTIRKPTNGEETSMTTTTLNWDQVQTDLRAGVYGDWREIRDRIAREEGEEHPGHGITSSDINHIAYGMVRVGELERIAEEVEK